MSESMKIYLGRADGETGGRVDLNGMQYYPAGSDNVCWFLHQDDHNRALRLLEQPDPDLDDEIGRLKREITELCDTYDEMKTERNNWKVAAECANEKAEKATEALIRIERSTPTTTHDEKIAVLKLYGLQCPTCQGHGYLKEEGRGLKSLLYLLERIEKHHTLFPDIEAQIARLREALS